VNTDQMSVLAVVPARGGSKGVPRKNLRVVGGLSLIARVAKVVEQLPWITNAILSTDDVEMQDEGRRFGLEVPFLRPADLSSDHSSSVDVWRHAWLQAEECYRRRYEISVLLEPTSPLRIPEDVQRTVEALVRSGRAAAATVSRTPAHFTPHKTLMIDDHGLINFYLPEGARHSLRQSIPPFYHRNGLCYAARRETVVDRRNIIERDCFAVLIERAVVNVDDMLDLRIADMLASNANT
jgi:CMP-N,N'-diacetyllegionaminic acid synthase